MFFATDKTRFAEFVAAATGRRTFMSSSSRQTGSSRSASATARSSLRWAVHCVQAQSTSIAPKRPSAANRTTRRLRPVLGRCNSVAEGSESMTVTTFVEERSAGRKSNPQAIMTTRSQSYRIAVAR
jgi:hypothetical protein